jgi:TetR/AcrR family transcriptional regulator, transcriptional repressor for nem operon
VGISNTPTAGTDVGEPMRRNLADQILTAGLEEFHSRGYHGSSVQDIATAAGAPKGSFYNHFSSKEALALAAIDAYTAENPVQVLADRSIPPVERLRAHFDIHRARFAESGYTRGCLVGNFAAEVADHCEPIREKLASPRRCECAFRCSRGSARWPHGGAAFV